MADKITSVLARESDGNIQITFNIPFSIIKTEREEVIKELAKDIEIPGFRRGMAPIDKAVEKIPQSKLIEHTLSHILPKALADTISENKLKIAVYPKFNLLSADENKDWQIRTVTCELPEIDLGDYKKAVAGASRASALWTPDKGKPDEKKEPTREEKEQTVIKALLGSVKVTIPKILIEEEADSRLSSLLSRLEKLGLALESYLASINKKPEDIRTEYTTQSRDAISLDLILSKIADAEGIKTDPKEIESALSVSEAASSTKDENPESLERRKRLIESILKRRKALDYLISLS